MPMYDATRTVLYDPILTNFSVGFRPQELIADQVFPLTPVLLESGQYRVFDRSNWIIWDDRREQGTAANEIRGFAAAFDNYRVTEHALKIAVTDDEMRNYNRAAQSPLTFVYGLQDPMQYGTQLLTQAILLRYEYQVSNLVRNLATYPTNNKLTQPTLNRWDNYGSSTSDPVNDLINMRVQIRALTGQDPNLLIIPWDVQHWLPNHPKVIARYQAIQAIPTMQNVLDLAAFNGRVLVPDSRYNTNDTPAQGENMVKFWGKDVIMAYIDPQPGDLTQTWGKTFAQILDNGEIRMVTRWRDEDRESTLVRNKFKYTVKLTQPNAAYILQNAVS